MTSHYSSFNLSRVGKANMHQVVQTLTNLDSEVETYDIKIAVKNKGKHDVRLKFVDRKPKIMAVKRDEEKLLITDILCLHRYSCSIQTFNQGNIWVMGEVQEGHLSSLTFTNSS